jgi:hypothetical protein
MELRAQRSPLGDLNGLRWDDPDADTTSTTELPLMTLVPHPTPAACAVARRYVNRNQPG